MTSQVWSCKEYLIPTDNIIVFPYTQIWQKNLASLTGFQYDLMMIWRWLTFWATMWSIRTEGTTVDQRDGARALTCPHRSSPAPNRMHQIQWSMSRLAVEKAVPPNSIMNICRTRRSNTSSSWFRCSITHAHVDTGKERSGRGRRGLIQRSFAWFVHKRHKTTGVASRPFNRNFSLAGLAFPSLRIRPRNALIVLTDWDSVVIHLQFINYYKHRVNVVHKNLKLH